MTQHAIIKLVVFIICSPEWLKKFLPRTATRDAQEKGAARQKETE